MIVGDMDQFIHSLHYLLADEYGDTLAEPLRDRIQEDVIQLIAKIERGEAHR